MSETRKEILEEAAQHAFFSFLEIFQAAGYNEELARKLSREMADEIRFLEKGEVTTSNFGWAKRAPYWQEEKDDRKEDS